MGFARIPNASPQRVAGPLAKSTTVTTSTFPLWRSSCQTSSSPTGFVVAKSLNDKDPQPRALGSAILNRRLAVSMLNNRYDPICPNRSNIAKRSNTEFQSDKSYVFRKFGKYSHLAVFCNLFSLEHNPPIKRMDRLRALVHHRSALKSQTKSQSCAESNLGELR